MRSLKITFILFYVRVAFLCNNLSAVSETFIRDQRNSLPGDLQVLFSHPPRRENGQRFAFRASSALRRLLRSPARVDEAAIDSREYFQLLKRIRPAVVLAHFGPNAARIAPACQQLGVPLVAHFHGYDTSTESILSEYQEQYRQLFQIAHCLIVVSTAMSQVLRELGAPPEKIRVNPCGVNLTTFHPSPVDRHADTLSILTVGRFVEKKGPLLTLRAFHELHREVPTARLRMIGEGPLIDDSRALTRELDLETQVSFLGSRTPNEVASEMRQADIFVQHSVRAANGDSEGTPVSVLEACASALPVVATRHGGIPEVITHEKNGLLVNEGDILGMVRALERLAKDVELRNQLGKAGRREVEAFHDQKRRMEALWKILIDASKSPGRYQLFRR